MFLLTDRRRRLVFDSCCAGALAVIASAEIILWLVRGPYGPEVFQIFAADPIPLGTVIILLSPGPLHLILSKNPPAKWLGGLLLLLGGLLIFFTHKRGTWVAVAAMLALGLIYLARRKKSLLLLTLLLMALILSFQTQRLIARFDTTTPRYISILDRLEAYNFALHIWKSHPFMGIGLRSYTHAQYLHDYQTHNDQLPGFPYTVAKLQTFDNMLLTAWVELGTAMTVLYLGLVLYILIRYGRKLWSGPESSPLDWYRVLVLLGVAIHSLSYDSLLVPPVNWLFHVQLGIMAGFQAAGTAPAEPSGRRPVLSEG
jgi:O-antigen ligase